MELCCMVMFLTRVSELFPQGDHLPHPCRGLAGKETDLS